MSVLEETFRVESQDDEAAFPQDPPRASASGPAPYRILLAGSGLLAGRGVRSHDAALTGCLARSLAGALGHGVDVEALILEEGVERIGEALRERAVAPFDAIVLVLGSEPADDLRPLLLGLRARLAPSAVLAVAVPPEDAGATVAEVRAASTGLADVVELEPDGEQHRRPAERYGVWADDIAHTLVTGLMAPQLWDGEPERFDESTRLRAVREAGWITPPVEQIMQRFVNLASVGYRTRASGISLIDETTTRYIASRRMDYPEQAREASICGTAMFTFGGLIVPDARLDERFQNLDVVREGVVGFYAGYPIVSPDGQPVGALCVFDPEARTADEQDLILLRDLASAAEREFWQVWPDAAEGDRGTDAG